MHQPYLYLTSTGFHHSYQNFHQIQATWCYTQQLCVLGALLVYVVHAVLFAKLAHLQCVTCCTSVEYIPAITDLGFAGCFLALVGDDSEELTRNIGDDVLLLFDVCVLKEGVSSFGGLGCLFFGASMGL